MTPPNFRNVLLNEMSKENGFRNELLTGLRKYECLFFLVSCHSFSQSRQVEAVARPDKTKYNS